MTMVLKIYTDQGSTIVIDQINHIEIHGEVHYIDPLMAYCIEDGCPHPDDSLMGASRKQGGLPTNVVMYDDYQKNSPVVLTGKQGTPIRFIDAWVKGEHGFRRIAIGLRGTAYLCNERGQTIERILEAGRAAA